LPFADVARDFRMIATNLEPVIISYDNVARRLIDELGKAERPAAVARRLQPYIVNVPPDPFCRLQRTGRAVPIQELRFADQFMVLTDEARRQLYNEDVGLDWSEATLQEAEASLV
jgi:CRISPR-associated endonuclease/helicase Cas3